MVTTALVMAGGRSERMRASAGPTHKALMRVLGVPLIERNLLALLSVGYRDIVVATNAHETAVAEYTHDRGSSLARLWNAQIECIEEGMQLGTIGVAAALQDRCDVLLVVNVDNLTAIDLRGLVEHHANLGSALTIATHQETLRHQFGELAVTDGQILKYTEKPSRKIWVSSGTYVVSAQACKNIAQGSRTDLPDLFVRLRACGEKVSAFQHSSPWIDVNDAGALLNAEQLILDNQDSFEHLPFANCHVADLIIRFGSEILIERRAETSSRYRNQWDLPSSVLPETKLQPEEVLKLVAQDFSGQITSDPIFLASFDDPDPTTRQIIKHDVFVMQGGRERPLASEGVKWVSLAKLNSISPLSSSLVRALAHLDKCKS